MLDFISLLSSIVNMPGGIHPPIAVVAQWANLAVNEEDVVLRPNFIFWIACILGPITVLMVGARLWVRVCYQRNVGWDDWLMLMATVRAHTQIPVDLHQG